MAKNLVIVESPAKAKTINKFIGKDYIVKASVGHVRDLPKSELGVDEKTFEPTYEILEGKEKVVSELKAAAKIADAVYIASDPDREGEAICQHLKEILDDHKGEVFRVLFNEITPKAIRAAMEKPGRINQHIVDAQQARRILDRLVGYQISPLLWDKVRRGISAGRVQTVALRMIVEREREILAFTPEEYWSIIAKLEGREPPPFSARLVKIKGKIAEVKNQAEADHILEVVKKSEFLVESVVTKEKKRNPVPPFTTSKLQQDAARRLRFTVKKTMMLAQRLRPEDIGKIFVRGSSGRMIPISTMVNVEEKPVLAEDAELPLFELVAREHRAERERERDCEWDSDADGERERDAEWERKREPATSGGGRGRGA